MGSEEDVRTLAHMINTEKTLFMPLWSFSRNALISSVGYDDDDNNNNNPALFLLWRSNNAFSHFNHEGKFSTFSTLKSNQIPPDPWQRVTLSAKTRACVCKKSTQGSGWGCWVTRVIKMNLTNHTAVLLMNHDHTEHEAPHIVCLLKVWSVSLSPRIPRGLC